jgi:2-oxoglutarate/2-oxoacid ferredoxin oxidoreductase subunit alpha
MAAGAESRYRLRSVAGTARSGSSGTGARKAEQYEHGNAAEDGHTPGDAPDVLVAMNPAALKTNLQDLRGGGLLIVNSGAFNAQNLKKAGYTANPLEDGSLTGYELLEIDINKQTINAVKPAGVSTKEANRCKNFWTLGLMFWIYGRDPAPTIQWIEAKFKKRPEIVEANILALKAGARAGRLPDHARERHPSRAQ